MAFATRNTNRRKPTAQQTARAAEACETRTLLSADSASVVTDGVQDSAEVSDQTDSSFIESGDEGCVDGQCDSEIVNTTDENSETGSDDPETSGDPGFEDGWEEGLDCGVAPEGFVPGDVSLEDADGDGVPDDFVMYPFDPLPQDEQGSDGLDCGVAPEGFVPGDVSSEDSDGDGVPDDFVMYPFDPLPKDELGSDGLDCGVAPDGFVPGDINGDGVSDDAEVDIFGSDWPDEKPETVEAPETDPSGNPLEGEVDPVRYEGGPEFEGEERIVDEVSDDFVIYPFDPLPIEEGGEVVDGEVSEVNDQVDFAEVLEWTSDGGEGDPNLIFYSFNMAPGSEAVQRNQDAEIIEPAATSVPVAVTNPAASPLFSGRPDPSGIGTLVSSQNQTVAAGRRGTDPARPALRRSSINSLVSSPAESALDQSEGLTPLLEGDNESPKPADRRDSTRDSGGQAVENATSDRPELTDTVAATKRTTPATFSVMAQWQRQRSVSIDRFMAEFAQDSFLS